jgi:hypothetical protein
VIVFPASTVPDVGAPETLDWQPLRPPLKLYEKFWALLLSAGEKFAVPCSSQPPTDCAAPADGTPANSITKGQTSPANTSLRIISLLSRRIGISSILRAPEP